MGRGPTAIGIVPWVNGDETPAHSILALPTVVQSFAVR